MEEIKQEGAGPYDHLVMPDLEEMGEGLGQLTPGDNPS